MAAKSSRFAVWLTESEDLICFAEEGVKKNRKILLLTQKRLILIQQTGAKEWSDIDDHMWKEFASVQLSQREGLFNNDSTLAINFSAPFQQDTWHLYKVKNTEATVAYRHMKNREVSMREAGKPPAKKPPLAATATVMAPVMAMMPEKQMVEKIKPESSEKETQPPTPNIIDLPEDVTPSLPLSLTSIDEAKNPKDIPVEEDDSSNVDDANNAVKKKKKNPLFARIRKKFG